MSPRRSDERIEDMLEDIQGIQTYANNMLYEAITACMRSSYWKKPQLSDYIDIIFDTK